HLTVPWIMRSSFCESEFQARAPRVCGCCGTFFGKKNARWSTTPRAIANDQEKSTLQPVCHATTRVAPRRRTDRIRTFVLGFSFFSRAVVLGENGGAARARPGSRVDDPRRKRARPCHAPRRGTP